MQYSLTDFRLFVAVAELLNLTRAAKRCHLSLAAVSQRIRAIEEEARCQLLERQARGVRLTPAGEAFARHARAMLRDANALTAELSDFAKGLQGRLTILANTTAVTEMMPAVLARFLAAHPTISVSLREHSNYEITRGVREGRADLGVVAGDVDLTGLGAIHLATDRVVLIAPMTHPLARRQSLSFAEVIAHPVVSLYEGSTLDTFVAGRVEAMGMPPLRPRVHVNSFEALCLMVEAGVGLAVAPESVARRYSHNMRIKAVPLSDDWATRKRYLVIRSLEHAPAHLRDLVADICEQHGVASALDAGTKPPLLAAE